MLLNSLALKFDLTTGLVLLDQTQLPHAEVWLPMTELSQMIEAIQTLRVRGAPLIGISACLFLAHQALNHNPFAKLEQCYLALRQARPTAVNLMNNLDQCWNYYLHHQQQPQALLDEAIRIFKQDQVLGLQMAELAQELVPPSSRILTYCNTGSLATAGLGTALGVIKKAHQLAKDIFVYTSETRPLGQGARLTYWELEKNNIPCQLICDNMAASLMQQKKIDLIFVGADRITKDYSVANKIGTYSLAVLAKYHQIPFYVVAPSTTFDPYLLTGSEIEIEQRPATEIAHFWSLKTAQVYNPGFDVTPPELITGIITEKNIIRLRD